MTPTSPEAPARAPWPWLMFVLGALALVRYWTDDVTETYLRVGLGLLVGGAGWLFARGILVRPTERLVVDRTADESRPPDAAERFTLPPSRFTLPPGLLDAPSDAETPQAAKPAETPQAATPAGTPTQPQVTTSQHEAMASASSAPHDGSMPASTAAPQVEAPHSAPLAASRDVATAAEPALDESTLVGPVDESVLVAPGDESTLVGPVDESALVGPADESTLIAPVDEDLKAT